MDIVKKVVPVLGVLGGASAPLFAQSSATPITIGANPVDVAGTVTNLWSFVSGPVGILMGFGLAIAIVTGLYRLARKPLRGK
jgi:ABC-type multidrug transport system permease subunit